MNSRSTHPRFPARHLLLLLALWLILYVAALFSPSLLDDADATHAEAARSMALTGDWVTLHVDGVRYLEKPPLPYWLVALSFRIFGFNTFAVHLPLALAVLALALLGYRWATNAFDEKTAFYTAVATLTCTGVFLFTRIFIPEALLSLFLCTALYAFLQCLASNPLEPSKNVRHSEPGAPFMTRTLRHERVRPYLLWTALALAVLSKGLIALIFFFGAAIPFLALTGEYKQWRRLRPFTGLLLFLLIAAPWHILASLRNTGGINGHGFAWFYFINEHVLRFLGRRFPRDYNKLPAALYWSLHLIWLFPWSLFAPTAALLAWRNRHRFRSNTPAARTTLLLALYTALTLIFFAFSTNQEYYTFPAYLPLLLLLCAAIANAENSLQQKNSVILSEARSAQSKDPEAATPTPTARTTSTTRPNLLITAHILFTAIGLTAAAALAFGLWTSRTYAPTTDLGSLLAHRGIGGYTLAMSHFFDLTGPSFAALGFPAALALLAFAFGPAISLALRLKRKHTPATLTVAATSAVFLVAAHLALTRFEPILSSRSFADKVETLTRTQAVADNTQLLLLGDQAYSSSIRFYLGRQLPLVDGRSTSLLFGSTFPDAPRIFLTSQDLAAQWGNGPRKLLYVPLEKRDDFDRLHLPSTILVTEGAGKALYTDRPLDTPH